MGNRNFKKEAQKILEYKVEFWRRDAAETLVEAFEELEPKIGKEDAKRIIQNIWNTALEEFGD